MWRVIRRDRVSFATALRRDQVRIDPLGDEKIGNGLCPSQRELLVVIDPLCTQLRSDRNVVRIAGHDDRGLLERGQYRSHFGDELRRRRRHLPAARREQQIAVHGDFDRPLQPRDVHLLLRYFPRLPDIAGKVLWGTDWPSPGVTSLTKNLSDFRALGLGEAAEKKILWENASRLFA